MTARIITGMMRRVETYGAGRQAMVNYKPDPAPEAGPGWYVSDDTPIPRHEFTALNQLEAFTFGENDYAELRCPDDCGQFCEPANLGEAVDWALGHKCEAAA